MTLIAEDLLLLLLDDEKGSMAASDKADAVLGGALLAELAIRGNVTVDEKKSMWRAARVHATGTMPPDEILVEAVAKIAEKDRSAQELVTRLGKGLKGKLADRLVGRGLIERRSNRVLGLFPRTRWPAVDTTHEDEVRRALTLALVQGQEPDERTGALVALLAAIDQAHKLVDLEGMSRSDVKARAKEIAAGDWAAKAVKDAVEAAAAAVAAVAVGASVATTSGSS